MRIGRLKTPSSLLRPWIGIPLLILLAAGTWICPPARADTVASLLGNFTINQFVRIRPDKQQVKLHFVVVLGQLPALAALHKADTNDDGVTSQAERDAYVKRLAPGFAKNLKVTAEGKPLPLHLVSWTSSLPSESTGFSLRLDAHYIGKLPEGLHGPIHQLTFDNTNYAGRIGWHEIVVNPGPGISIFNTNAVSTSMTKGLSINPEKLPPSGPLDERAVHLAFAVGAPPVGAVVLHARTGYPAQLAQAGQSTQSGQSSEPGLTSGITATGVALTWINRATKRLVDLISARHLPLGVALLALLIAMALGGLHAFSPGHGKTVVGAYLIGSRGTPRHAVFLGLTVTITHTIGVFALGFATLLASQFVVPEKLFPILSLVSGLLVVGIGLALFIRRWRGMHDHAHTHHHAQDSAIVGAGTEQSLAPAEVMAADANAASLTQTHPQHHPDDHGHSHEHGPHVHDDDYGHSHSNDRHDDSHELMYAYAHEHDHGHSHGHDHHDHSHGAPNAQMHEHDHGHTHSHDHADHAHGSMHAHALEGHDALTHSHGGRMHTHLPPGTQGESVTWRSLLGLGISGGLIPCPSAMVLLLATVALHKTAYGLIMVLAFSVGLAVTLTCVGLAFLYARRFLGRAKVPGRLVQVLPMVSAGIITVVGLVITYGAIAGVSMPV